MSKAFKEADFVQLWNASLNANDLWKVQEKILPVSAIYFRSLLSGINDQLIYNLEKGYAKRWENENQDLIRKQQHDQSKEGTEGEENQTTQTQTQNANYRFNLDYFSWVLQHRDFELTPRDIQEPNLEKIRDSFILEQ